MTATGSTTMARGRQASGGTTTATGGTTTATGGTTTARGSRATGVRTMAMGGVDANALKHLLA